MRISIFQNVVSKQPASGQLQDIAGLMRSDSRLKAFTESYRQTGSKSLKSECPHFAVACLFEGGKCRENVTRLTGLSLVDFDHVAPPPDRQGGAETPPATCTVAPGGRLAEMKRRIIADPHTLMCYTTISGNGLRVIFRYEFPPTDAQRDKLPQITQMGTDKVSDETAGPLRAVALQQQNPCESVQSVGENKYPSARIIDLQSVSAYYQQAFYAGNAYYEKLIGAKADMQCKNVTRLSGLAHDPDVYVNMDAVPFSLAEIETAGAAHARQSKEEKQMHRIQAFYDTVVAPQLAEEGIVYASGSHNNYVMRVGYRMADRRFSRALAVMWAKRTFPDYDGTEQVFNSCYDNCRPAPQRKRERREGKAATVEDINAFLGRSVSLRFNEVTSRVEYESTAGKAGGRRYMPVTDRVVNSLWTQMSASARVNIQDMYRVIESDYVPLFNPFTEYLNGLPQITQIGTDEISDNISTHSSVASQQPDLCESVKSVGEKNHSSAGEKDKSPSVEVRDYIRELAQTVRVKGGEAEQDLWLKYLRKWLVGMVASWLNDDVVNNVILVLIGEQGAYKTTWFNSLLPPALRQYFYTKTNANRMSRDDLLTLAQYGLVCCEELDTMRPAELNQLKAVVTMPCIDERAAYAHFHEHRSHIASFCGTGNNMAFLSDPTGNRRWLPFEVERIRSPREHPFCHDGIFAQALSLYKEGFRYWFTKEEVTELNVHNQQFETPRLEHELVDLYFRKPMPHENGIFMSVASALQTISYGISQKLSAINVGKAFADFGFERVRTKSSRGFIVVCRTAEEMKAYQFSQASEGDR